MQRALRRSKTKNICRKRYKDKIAISSDLPRDDSPYKNLNVFSKKSFFTCGCSKKRHGRPKVGKGICQECKRQTPVYRQHIKQFCKAACLEVDLYDPRIYQLEKLIR